LSIEFKPLYPPLQKKFKVLCDKVMNDRSAGETLARPSVWSVREEGYDRFAGDHESGEWGASTAVNTAKVSQWMDKDWRTVGYSLHARYRE
jgi:hypothetical protein